MAAGSASPLSCSAASLARSTFGEPVSRSRGPTAGGGAGRAGEGVRAPGWGALRPEAPMDCDIEIHASPRGKRTQRIHLLSSGERALVALSLLFGIFLTKPSPFCLLDEVDAPLDDANVGRFVRMLTQFKTRTQFIVITHNPRTTTEAADAVYGVTMQEPGVSSLVSVRMRGASAVDDALAGLIADDAVPTTV